MKQFHFFIFLSLICLAFAETSDQCDSDFDLDNLDRKAEDCIKEKIVKEGILLNSLASKNVTQLIERFKPEGCGNLRDILHSCVAEYEVCYPPFVLRFMAQTQYEIYLQALETHQKNLNLADRDVDTLQQNRLNPGNIDLSSLGLGNLDLGSLDLNNLDLSKLSSGNVDLSKLNLGNIDLNKLIPDNLDLSRLNLGNIDLSKLNLGNVDLSKLNTDNIDLSKLIPGNLDLSKLGLGNLGRSLDLGNLDLSKLNLGNFDLTKLIPGNLNLGNLDLSQFNLGNLDLSKLNLGNINEDKPQFEKLIPTTPSKVSFRVLCKHWKQSNVREKISGNLLCDAPTVLRVTESYDSCLEQATEDLQKLIGKSDPEICPKVKSTINSCGELMAQCYKPQELEEINRSVLISMANAQRSIVAMLIKFKPDIKTYLYFGKCKVPLVSGQSQLSAPKAIVIISFLTFYLSLFCKSYSNIV